LASLRETFAVLKTIRHLLELIRFSHTLFALPFAMLAAVMAWRLQFLKQAFQEAVQTTMSMGGSAEEASIDAILGVLMDQLAIDYGGIGDSKWQGFAVRWQEVVGIVLCMVTARSFAMAMNRLADRRLDAANPRTAGRHLPAGILSLWQVTTFSVLCAVGFVASTLLFLPNRLPLYLSVPVLLFLAGYSYAKRFTSLAHFWLGTALALSPVAAWIAIRGEQVIRNPAELLPALVLGGAVLTWVAGFDIIYACQDYDADRKAMLHSVPVKLGIPGALRLAAACHLLTIVLLAGLPLVYPFFGWIFWAGVVAVAVLLVYEHLLVRPNDLSRVNAAFFNVNAVISLGLFAVGTLDLMVGGGGY
jgi:4-hydroxybenzoate polyprenyltransferase